MSAFRSSNSVYIDAARVDVLRALEKAAPQVGKVRELNSTAGTLRITARYGLDFPRLTISVTPNGAGSNVTGEWSLLQSAGSKVFTNLIAGLSECLASPNDAGGPPTQAGSRHRSLRRGPNPLGNLLLVIGLIGVVFSGFALFIPVKIHVGGCGGFGCDSQSHVNASGDLVCGSVISPNVIAPDLYPAECSGKIHRNRILAWRLGGGGVAFAAVGAGTCVAASRRRARRRNRTGEVASEPLEWTLSAPLAERATDLGMPAPK